MVGGSGSSIACRTCASTDRNPAGGKCRWRLAGAPAICPGPEGQKMPPVAGHQVVGIGGHNTLKDAVVGVTAFNDFR